MKKIVHSLSDKTFLRCIIVILCILIGNTIFLYTSPKNKTQLNIKKNDNSAEIKKNIAKADILFDKSSYDSAYLYYKKAIILCDPIEKYVDDYAYSELSIANLYQNINNYTACEESIARLLPYLKKTTKPKFTYNTYTILAYNYYFTYDNYNAILYHKKALKLAPTPFKKVEILTDLVLIYETQKKYKEVIDILEPLALRKIKHETDSTKTDHAYSLLLNVLGYSYHKLGNPKALDCFKKSLEIQLRLNQQYELMSTYGNLAMFYSKKDARLSKMYSKKQYTSACIANSPSFKANSLALLIGKSEGEELKKYSKAYIKIIDSILTDIKNNKTQLSVIKYKSKIDKDENLKLKAEQIENELQLEQHKNRNIISYIVITIIIDLILFLSLYLILKGKKEKKQAIIESEMRISDQLRNELTREVYNTLIFAKNKDFENAEDKDQLLDNLENIYSQTRNISKENSTIITDENYLNELKEMISGFKTQNLNLLTNGLDTINWNKINKNKKIIVYRVFQELFQNIKRYSNPTLIVTSFKIIEKNITVIVSDNGTGTKNDRIILENSIQNVENRIKTINGTLNFDNSIEKGVKLIFTFPL